MQHGRRLGAKGPADFEAEGAEGKKHYYTKLCANYVFRYVCMGGVVACVRARGRVRVFVGGGALSGMADMVVCGSGRPGCVTLMLLLS